MKALSIRQPWAWLICAGYKDIENRTWPTKFRGRFYIHAGKIFDEEGYLHLLTICLNASFYQDGEKLKMALRSTHDYLNEKYLGVIIGEVDIVDCVDSSDSPWFEGPYGFTLANPVLYENPIPCRGRLGFFEPDIEVKR